MPFEEFVVVNRTEHKVQCAKLNAQRLKGFVPFEEFVVINRTEHKVQCAKLNAQRLKGFVPFEEFVVQVSKAKVNCRIL